MTLIDEISRGLEEIVSHRDNLTDQTNEGVFNNLTFQLGRLDERVREHIQQSTSEHILAVIDRLDSDESLSEEDHDMIRLWFIGDAVHYVQMETDYPNWLAKLNRLIGVMAGLRGKEPTIENVGKISGAIREALRVIGDIVFFKSQEERISRFEQSIKRFGPDDRRMISGVLKDKLRSSMM